MDIGQKGQEQLRRTMGCLGPTMTLLQLCVTFLTLHSISNAAAVSPRLPAHVVMGAIIAGNQEPLNLDYVSLRWEHKGRPLVEYKDKNVISYEPRVSMPQEQFKDGNFSLILHNITITDSGNYTCLIQYDKQQRAVQYALRVEKHRIQLFDLSPKKVEENTDNNAHRIRLINRSSKKLARESRQPSSGVFLQIGGNSHMMAKPGDNVSLMCKFNTDPSMELTMLNIRWSKDGATKWIFNKEIQGDQAKLEELSKGNANLNLASVQSNDSGKYTCNIVYKTLEKNISTILIVRDGENLSAPTVPRVDKYRKEKIGLVVGVVAVVNCLAFLVYFCVAV